MATQSYVTKSNNDGSFSSKSLENSSLSQSDVTSDTYDGGDFVPPPTSWFEHADDCLNEFSGAPNQQLQIDASSDSLDFRLNNVTLETSTNSGHSSALHRWLTPYDSPVIPSGAPTNTIPGQRLSLQMQNFNDEPLVATAVIGNSRPSPSWKEVSSQILPMAARELLSNSLQKLYHTARLGYSRGRWHWKYSDMGNVSTGAFTRSNPELTLPDHLKDLPPFSSLPWIDRQLVREWRTYLPETPMPITTTIYEGKENEDHDDFDYHAQDFLDYERARTLVPNILPRSTWQKSDVCYDCHQNFGPTRLRHHCRSCGRSFCNAHSSWTHRLPHLGYEDVPERVCDRCKRTLDEQTLAERVAWRLARCRDYSNNALTPYFETGLDSVEEVVIRVTKAAIAMAKAIPLGAQATVAVETVNVLRKYGLHGIYGIMLRQEFLAAADLLRKALGINKTSWPLSVHELSAAIFYALAQHRAMRGLNPEREHIIHRFRTRNNLSSGAETGKSLSAWTQTNESNPNTDSAYRQHTKTPRVVDSYELSALDFRSTPVIDHTDIYNPDFSRAIKIPPDVSRVPANPDLRRVHSRLSKATSTTPHSTSFTPVCDPVSDAVMASLVFYAPIALNFVYAEKEVDMQLLAAQQGWRLLYAYLAQDLDHVKPMDRPASALFLHEGRKIACLSIRGTATINDVITDIRQIPVPFPDLDQDNDGDWTNVFHGQGLALCGMASAASNLLYEHFDSILYFAQQGYKIRLVGHSLGGGVATLLGILVLKHLERILEISVRCSSTVEEAALLKVYAYGTPSCLEASLADSVDIFVTTVVLHDDVFPRLTPTSCRGLLKHLLHIRETWVKYHIEEDLRAVGERAKTAWAPRFRQGFALSTTSTSSIKTYCKKQIQKGKRTLKSVKDKAIGRPPTERMANDTKVSLLGLDHSDNTDANVEVVSTSSGPNDWGEKFFLPATEVSITDSFDSANEGVEFSGEAAPVEQAQLLLELLGCGNVQAEGLVVDGDEFFETEESLLEGSDEESETASDNRFRDSMNWLRADSLHSTDCCSLDTQKVEACPEMGFSSPDTEDDNGIAAVVVDEIPLPRMFIPGKIVHIYSHRGIYKAAYVPRTFRELRRISLAGNMLKNHTSKAYYEGLLEVQTARVAPEAPPRWTSFDEDDTCCCCANRFTWASTSNSEAQEARDKHNCRSCGGLVCHPCSKNRVPIPSIGLTTPVRTCDRCYNDILGGVSAVSSVMTSSFLETDNDYPTLSDTSTSRPRGHERNLNESDKRPERRRPKRSMIVDNLVLQMRSSTHTHHY